MSDGNGTKNKVSKQAPKQRKNTEPPVKEFRSFVLMEWGGGSVFWGIKKVVYLTDDFFVCNGSKSSGKIVNGVLDFDDIYQNSNTKLNLKDKEVNPNMEYCLWELAKDNMYIKMTEDTNTFEIKTDKETFIEELKVQFQKYMKD